MIAITGATGALNGATLGHLLRLSPGAEVVAVVRDPARATHLTELGVEVRQGDYADPAGLRSAYAGVSQLLLVSSNDPTADAVDLHRTAVTAAVEAGVGRILYTSHQGASPETPFKPGRDHAATEEILAASGVPWTSLRNGFYLHSLDWLAGPWRESGVVTVPADGPVSWTSREDSAEAAAVVLAAGGGFEGPVTMTAAEAPTFAEVAQVASEVSGRPVRLEVVDEEEWVAQQVAAGTDERRARFTLGMYQAARDGFFRGTDLRLGELLGREPRSVRDHLAA
ncbi:NAD(P)H-binding protein [Nocardioides korecus]